MEVLELKNKNFLEGLNNRFEQARERIGAFEDEPIEIIQSEQKICFNVEKWIEPRSLVGHREAQSTYPRWYLTYL